MSESAFLTRARELLTIIGEPDIDSFATECAVCHGTGRLQSHHEYGICEACGGSGDYIDEGQIERWRAQSLSSLLTQVRNEALASAEQDNKRLREALTNLLADAEYPRRSQSHIDAARAALKTGEQAL